MKDATQTLSIVKVIPARTTRIKTIARLLEEKAMDGDLVGDGFEIIKSMVKQQLCAQSVVVKLEVTKVR